MTTSRLARALKGIVLAGATLGMVLTGAPAATAAPAPAPAINAVDFTGTVALSNCSGSVVRTAASQPTDPVLVLSNGHCVRLMAAGEVIVNQASSRAFSLLDSTGQRTLGTLRATRLAYATMTNTDVSIYQTSTTYAQLQQQFGSRALQLSAVHPTQGTDIRVVSGFHRTIYSCAIDGFAFRVREDRWTWRDSIRYTPSCRVIGGTSGSPVVDAASGQVVGVNNTINEQGQRCTLNNPCEVAQNGAVTVRRNIGYAQETFYISPCVTTGSRIDLTRPGCGLPR